jgi:hypothetical protein
MYMINYGYQNLRNLEIYDCLNMLIIKYKAQEILNIID